MYVTIRRQFRIFQEWFGVVFRPCQGKVQGIFFILNVYTSNIRAGRGLGIEIWFGCSILRTTGECWKHSKWCSFCRPWNSSVSHFSPGLSLTSTLLTCRTVCNSSWCWGFGFIPGQFTWFVVDKVALRLVTFRVILFWIVITIQPNLYTHLSLHSSLYQEDERAKPGSPRVNSAVFLGVGGRCLRIRVFSCYIVLRRARGLNFCVWAGRP
jgi:hypothetical protein